MVTMSLSIGPILLLGYSHLILFSLILLLLPSFLPCLPWLVNKGTSGIIRAGSPLLISSTRDGLVLGVSSDW